MPIVFKYYNKNDFPVFVLATAHLESDRKSLIKACLEVFGYANQDFQILTQPNGKPFGVLGDKIIQLSISHTKDRLFLVMGFDSPLGLDVEYKNRDVHPGLLERMMHTSDERNIHPLKLWTLKEAFLKMTGTGLRIGMNKVGIEEVSKNLYIAKCPKLKTKAQICHLTYREYLVSVAFMNDRKRG